MATSKFTPPAVPSFEVTPQLRAYLDEQMRRLGVLVNDSPLLSEDETITGDWTFTGTVTLPEVSITDHEAALTILESQITDGAVLARLADNETVAGEWTFSATPTFTVDPVISFEDPALLFIETDAAANNTTWDFRVQSEQLFGRVINDAQDAAANWLVVNRTANVIDEIELGATLIDLNGVVDFDSVPTGHVTSGTYTPTLTNGTNVASSTADVCQYMRVGNTVFVSGSVVVDPTSTNTYTEVDLTLPVASNLGDTAHLSGTASALSSSGPTEANGSVFAATATDTARIAMLPDTASSRRWRFTFGYQVI